MNRYTLFDRIINLYFFRRKADGTVDSSVKGFTLKCPSAGLKPDISLSYKQADGVTYQVIVKVGNFIPTLNINNYNALQITMGYSNCLNVNSNVQVTNTLTMAITNSFTEQPMPNGVWQVNGIISDWFSSMGAKNEDGQLTCFDIVFNEDTTTIGTLIEKIVTLLGVQAHYDHSAKWLNYELKLQRLRYRGTSYWGTLRWLISQLNQFSKCKLDPDKQMICSTFDDAQGRVQLYIWKEGDQNYADSTEPYTKIKLIYSFQLIGPTAQITMPFYPTVLPGSLIQITPAYYSSQVIPAESSLDAIDKTTDNNLAKTHMYRVLLSSVAFSTTGSANQMIIKAVPASTYTKTEEIDNTNLSNDYNSDESNAKNISETKELAIGNSEIDDSEARTMIQSLADIYGSHFPGGTSTGVYYTIQAGDTLSSLAKSFYGDKIQAINYSHYRSSHIYTKNLWVNGDYLSPVKTALEALDKDVRMTSVYASALWPLIVLGTYVVARRDADKQNSPTPTTMYKLGWCTSILKDPDVVEVGKKVWIFTNFNSPDDIKTWAAPIFSTMASFYEEHQDEAHPWRTTLEIGGMKAASAFMSMANLPE